MVLKGLFWYENFNEPLDDVKQILLMAEFGDKQNQTSWPKEIFVPQKNKFLAFLQFIKPFQYDKIQGRKIKIEFIRVICT